MRKKLLAMLILSVLVGSNLIGCESGGSPCPSTLTILSISEGDVSVMKDGTSDWVEAESEMELEVGDAIKTGGNSSAEITFFDGSTMELEAGTEIEILSLDLVCDTGVTTITLNQTVGTTISRVTKLLDTASSYEIETPTGMAGVRGSTMIVTVGGNGTTLITNVEGEIYAIGRGTRLDIPVGRIGIIESDQEPELVNNSPMAEDDTITTDEDNPIAVYAPGVLDNDSDPDIGDTLTMTAVDTSGTIGLIDAWDADGAFTYNPNDQFEYLQAGSSTTDSFTYIVSDGNGGTGIATVTITVSGVNDAPVAVNDSAITNEGTPVTIDILDNDFDPDFGDTLTVESVTQGTNGSVSHNSSYVTYAPDTGFNGTDSFNYTVNDGNGGTDTATVTVAVTVTGTPAAINVQIDIGPTASIFIWNDSTGGWAIDLNTQEPIDGTNHETPAIITIAGGPYYYIWVGAPDQTYLVSSYPKHWDVRTAPVGEAQAAYGYVAAGSMYAIHCVVA